MIALRDFLDTATDVMNGADFPAQISGQAAEFSQWIDRALTARTNLDPLRASAERLIGEWLKRDDLQESYQELSNIERVLRQLPANVGQAEQPSPAPKARIVISDYRITAAENLGAGGARTKYRDNIAAIRTLQQLEEESRPPTPSEQALLVRYVGWGGLPQAFDPNNTEWADHYRELAALLPAQEYEAARRSTQDAHYTGEPVVRGIYKGLERLGFTGGRMLEPAAGTGHFIGLAPESIREASRFTTIELDPVTARICKHLYPSATVINRGYQDVTIPADHFDAVVGNPPFGSQSVYDARHTELNQLSIHNYFIAKSIDKLRPGGVAAFVVSSYFMDARDAKARELIAGQADLLGAIRLPNTAFKQNALTEVTTDILFFQKRQHGQAPVVDWTEAVAQQDLATGEVYPLNTYFVEHPDQMLGDMVLQDSMYRANTPTLRAREGFDLASGIDQALQILPSGIYRHHPDLQIINDESAEEDIEVPENVKIGAYFLLPDRRIARRIDDLIDKPRAQLVVPKSERAGERIQGMVEVRTSLRHLMAAEQRDSTTDGELSRLRQDLNRTYDRFVKRHSYISSMANRQAFRDDPEYPLLHALERNYDKGISKDVAKATGAVPREASAEKAAIFTKRVISPKREITQVETAKDAMVVSMNELGRVDMPLMTRISGKTQDDVIAELRGLIYQNPTNATWQTADQYLSGNVKEKLNQAEIAAQRDVSLLANVDALTKVIPPDIDAVDISVDLGTAWVPAPVIEQFVTHLLGDVRRSISYQEAMGKWVAQISHPLDRTIARSQWGTEEIPANELIANILTGKSIEVRERTGTSDAGNPVYTINEALTAAASQKADEIRQAFRDWIWEDKDRRESLARLYNDRFNTNVPPRYDGSHLTLPGSSLGITPRTHQLNAIWRGIQEGGALFDHRVGAGKTFVCIGTIMESRRMGLMQKPMVVVPNHLLLQWKDAFYELYPNANILVAEKTDFTKENRERLFAQIATGDYDAVIVAHSSFKKIGMPEATLEAILSEQIDDLTESITGLKHERGDRITIKELEKTRDRMKARMERSAETGSKDRSVSFADLGVDAILVDESHEFKNLFINTTMNRVSGLGNLAGSDKAFDLFVKARHVQRMNDGRGVFFSTGTPISNTIAEMYTVQRYMQYDEMKQRGIVHFDAWASTFGQVVTGWELDATGVNYRLNSRFAKFQNVPELVSMYRSFADVITKTDLEEQAAAQGKRFPVPKLKGGKPENVILERSPLQAQYMGVQSPQLDGEGKPMFRADGSPILSWTPGSIIHRMENLPRDPRLDNPLKITNDARKAGLDFRLIDADAPDFAGSKVNAAVDRIFDVYQRWDARKGTQLVFCDLSTPKKPKAAPSRPHSLPDDQDGTDLDQTDPVDETAAISMDELLSQGSSFSVYDDIRDKLIARGIPADQIRFIHEADTDAKKDKLFAAMNNGDVRVLLGSTAKMGAGTNVQRLIVASHNLDAPWRPSDLEQRDGRSERQGNMFYEEDPENFEIENYRYATKQTYDARMWQTIETKASGIEQFRRGDSLQRVIEDIAGESANAAEMKAAATGNPLIFQQVQLSSDLKKLEAGFSNYKRNRHALESRIAWLSGADKRADTAISDAQLDMTLRDKNTSEDLRFTAGGRTFGKEQQDHLLGIVLAGMKEAIEKRKLAYGDAVHPVPIGQYRGFEVAVFYERDTLRFQLQGHALHSPDNLKYAKDDEFKLSGFFSRIDNYLAKLDSRVGHAEYRRQQENAELINAKNELAKAFPQQQQLEILRRDVADVMSELKKSQADPAYISNWVPISAMPHAERVIRAVQVDGVAAHDISPSQREVRLGDSSAHPLIGHTEALPLPAPPHHFAGRGASRSGNSRAR
jgi:N12 class adenine-specific DNA methylase/predicted RNA methylase